MRDRGRKERGGREGPTQDPLFFPSHRAQMRSSILNHPCLPGTQDKIRGLSTALEQAQPAPRIQRAKPVVPNTGVWTAHVRPTPCSPMPSMPLTHLWPSVKSKKLLL